MSKYLCLIIMSALVMKATGAITIYVCPPAGYGTNNPPYTNWADASTNIIAAVNSATNGDTVLVTNGTYYLTNQINVVQNILVRSMNGSNTVVNGNYPHVTNRCFYITNSGSVVDGFTITNGVDNAQGGGVILFRGTLRNCMIVNNRLTNSASSGGGIYLDVGGVMTNCIVMRNGPSRYGGGAFFNLTASSAYNCQFSENTNNPSTGACVQFEGGNDTIVDSIIYNNYGDGISLKNNVSVLRCKIIGNTCMGLYFGINTTSFARNCLIASNGTYGVLVYNYAIVENCTISKNNTGVSSVNAALVAASFINTIISDNTSGTSPTNWIADQSKTFFTNCCTTPLVTTGPGNIDASPQFRSAAEGNYRLKNTSPCINAGTNQAWMTGAVDLDGRTRIRYGMVDMGAYERINEGTIYKLH